MGFRVIGMAGIGIICMGLLQGQGRLQGLAARTSGGGTDERIRRYSELAAARPDEGRLRARLALEYLQKVRETGEPRYLDLAAKLADGLLTENQENTDALRIRNEIGLQRHEFRRVAADARRITSMSPSDASGWSNLGDALMELGQYEQAGEAYRRMVVLRADLSSYNRAGYHAFVTGRTQAAIAFMHRAIESGSETPEPLAWCWVELADMYFKAGELERAEEAYRKAASIYPSLHRAYAGTGRVAWVRDRLPEAMEAYGRAQAIRPLPEYAVALSDLHAQQGHDEQSQKQWKLFEAASLVAYASGEKANRVAALTYADHGRSLDHALELVKAEFENRDDVYTYDALAWVLFKLRRYEEAHQAMEKALRAGTPEPHFYFHAGMIAQARGKGGEARERFGQCLALNPWFDPRQAGK